MVAFPLARVDWQTLSMAPSLVCVRRLGFAVLLAGAAASAQAQEGRGTAPETTLSETPAVGPADADREARTLFEQGRVAYQEGRYRDAWDYFRQAYLLSKRPALLYNVGQAADRLRKDREALEAFRMYLAQVPQAENRREVENRVRALEQQVDAAQPMQTAPPPASPDPAYAPLPAQQPGDPWATAPAGGTTAEATPSGESRQPTRSGWYVRLAAGLGFYGDSVDGPTPGTSLTSLTLVSHLGIGHDVIEGLVVAGALDFLWGLTATAHVDDVNYDVGSANLTLILALADYYFSPQKNGWHASAGLGFAFFSISESNAVLGIENPSGGALVLAGGHDWPLAREWAFGILGRLTFAQMSNDSADHTLFALSAMANVNWF
jgi:tetratricopeptide (TPR) repeat protein